MKQIVKEVRDLIEAAEPGMTVIEMKGLGEESFACPVAIARWEEYRRRNPDGLDVPPVDLIDCADSELQAYAKHVNSCVDCKDLIAHGERPD